MMAAQNAVDKSRVNVGDIVTAWLGSGFTRRAEVILIDQDGMAHVRYPDYPGLGVDYVMVSNLS